MAKKHNDKGLKYKLEAIQALPAMLSTLAKDGAGYFAYKIRDEVAKKPKNSPSGEVGGGYIRNITGAFRMDASQVTPLGQAMWLVKANTAGRAGSYFMKVWKWSKERYGYTPHEIVRGKYTQLYLKGVAETLKEFTKAFNTNPKKWEYVSPFGDEYVASINARDAG